MHWIDAHSHLSFFSQQEIASLVSDGDSKNLKLWILAGYNSRDWSKQADLKLQYPDSVQLCFGLHPWQVAQMSPSEIQSEIQRLEQKLSLAIACGETGIDRLKGADQVDMQREVFIRHLEINRTHNKPLVLHSVHADEDILQILKAYPYTGIVHRFSGSYEVGKKYLDLGYKLSISRTIFSQGYTKLKECVRRLQLTDFVIESDAGLNAQGNAEDATDLFFKAVRAISEIQKVSHEELLRATYETTKKVFQV